MPFGDQKVSQFSGFTPSRAHYLKNESKSSKEHVHMEYGCEITTEFKVTRAC